MCNHVRKLRRATSTGGTISVLEKGFLAESFAGSMQGKALIKACESMIHGHREMTDERADTATREFKTSFLHQV